MNKKIKVIILGILMVMVVVGLTGCSTENKTTEDERFVCIDVEEYYNIVYDRETKVQYAISNGSYNRGTVTLLVDKDGKPLLYEE